MVGSKGYARNELQFKNMMGIVKLQVTGIQTIVSLTVTTAGEKIAGEATVAMDYTDTPQLVMDETGTTSITLTDVNTTLSHSTATAFYIALPAGEYAAGMKFELRDTGGTIVWNKTTKDTFTVDRSRIVTLTTVDAGLYFPDAEFRKLLVAKYGLALTADGTDIDIANIYNIKKFGLVTELDCSAKNIASLNGIEFFTA